MRNLLGNIVSSTIIISTVTCAVHESLSRAGVVGPWTIVDRDANSRTWTATITEESPSGGTTYRTNYVQELATGMHFKGPSGEWQESQETFSILPDGSGAVAQNGPYQVFAPSDIYEGTINITLPSGEVLKTRPVGISYFDGTNNILIAELTNSIGQLSADGKTVTWASAFSDFAADIVATYHKGYFECDLIFREQPPTPGSLGLTDNCRLQLLTETFDSPTPEVESETQSPANGAAPGTDPSGLTNSAPVVDGIPYASTLKFGGMRMPAGQAFFIGSHGNSGKSFNVHKSWLHTQGRQFLIEDLKYNVVEPDLSQLQSSTVQPSKDKLLAKGVLNHRRLGLPGFRPARKSTRKMELTRADIGSKPGFVWDYVLQGSTNGFTLKADTEYVVTGPFYVSGVLVIEGGSLIRYTNSSSAKISFSGPLACRTDFYRPAIFTCQNDKSVGAFWGTGSVGPIAATYLEDTSTADNAYRHLRFCYANKAISITTGYQGNELWHCQFVQCTNAVVSTAYRTLGLYNVLASGCGTLVSSCSSFIAQHVTSDQCGTFGGSITYASSSTLTNCILTGLTNLNASFVQANCRQASSGVGIYQSAGAGYYYLASGSGCQDAGSTNLHPRLLRDLQRLTTWPPVLVSAGSLPGDQTFSPQVQLDTDIPDQGFHYYSLDYALGAVYTTNAANISITPGTALAAYAISNSATPWGLNVGAGANLSSKGTATAPVWITSYNMVQEQPVSAWAKPSSGLMSDSYSGGTGGGLSFRFTQFSSPAQDDYNIYSTTSTANLQDCQIHAGLITANPSHMNLINCLVERVWSDLESSGSPAVVLRNNTFIGGVFRFYPTISSSVIKDNLFDQTALTNNLANNGYSGGYNAFVTNCNRLNPTYVTDVVLTNSPAYQVGPLGNYYLPDNSLLINAGSQNSSNASLYHYTTTLSGIETNSQVDIGFHTVAVGSTSGSSVWVDDSVPPGSTIGLLNDVWNWTNCPTPFAGTYCHVSATYNDTHQHYFYSSPSTLTFGPDDTLFCWVYLNPTNMPSEIMLEWQVASPDPTYWYHRAIWGTDYINTWGTRTYMGPIPAATGWVRLEVPVWQVNLAGRAVNGMAFALSGASAAWDYAGKVGSRTPLDRDGDGTPNYLEDLNGNGIPDTGLGETDWTNYTSPNGLTTSAGLQVFTPLK